MVKPSTNNINVLAELERIGYSYKWSSDEEVEVCCPFHKDESPSCAINLEKKVFNCATAGCRASGDIIKFLARVLKTTRAVIFADLSKRYLLDNTKVINADVIERYHSRLESALPLMKELKARGVTRAIIRKYRLGEDGGRVTIPIQNEGGLFINVRRYLPGAPGKDKMRNTRGHGQIRIYPVDQLQYDTIAICGGEIKAIVVADQLNKKGIGAVSATGGEGNWDPKLTTAFTGKKVYVILDIDDEGQIAAKALCNILSRVANWVGNLILPLDKDKYPHGDPNDFIATEKGNLFPLLADVKKWEPEFKQALDQNETPIEMTLAAACTAESSGKRLSVKAVVSAMDTAPYVVPAEVQLLCDKSQQECALCPIYIAPPIQSDKYKIPCESQAVLAMVGSKTKDQREAIMLSLGIPRKCRSVEFEPLKFYNVEDVRVSPDLEITSRAADRAMQPAVAIGQGLELNETYKMTGRMHPHPDNQQSTLVISNYETAEDALSSYQPTDLEDLEIFNPKEWTTKGIRNKLTKIYSDFEANVTRIFQRRALHLMIDLVYHSPLFIEFDGKTTKGWAEILIMGDSAQGKSEATMSLMRFYGLGEKAECKNASVAGLLGGLQQIGGKWFVTWGIIPTHDKRLVVLEELKGANIDVISKLTDMRSSGIAEIPKIEKRRTHARTRIIALSNSRSGQAMSSYNFGIEAIPELIGGLEDVRRFDACLIVNSNEIDSAKINQLQTSRPQVEVKFTDELCRRLILWVWTRSTDQVIFQEGSEKLVLSEATALCSAFSDMIPIVDRGSMRLKLARLAASLAGRTFSCSEDRMSIVVRPCHVQFVSEFLQKTYSSDAFGYSDFTKAVKLTSELKDEAQIKKQIQETPFPREFVDQLLHTTNVDSQDVQDWCSWDRTAAMHMVSFLVRKHALQRDGRSYRKSPAFIGLLKSLLIDGLQDRPSFIDEPNEEF